MSINNPLIKRSANMKNPSETVSGPVGKELEQPKKPNPIEGLKEEIKKLRTQTADYAKKLKNRELELREKKERIQQLEAEQYAQKRKVDLLQKQVKEQKETISQLQKQAEADRKEAEKYRAKAELADQYRQEVWNLVVQSGAVAEHVARQNRDYGKLCNKLYRDIQYVLGSVQTGSEWEELRQELRASLHKFFADRCREDEWTELPEESQPPLLWTPDSEAVLLRSAQQEAVQPDRAFRLLAEKLLILLESGKAEELPVLLEQCGVQVLFYGDAPEETRDTAYFAFYESGMELPALVGLRTDDTRLQVLARGAHVC